MAVRCPSQRRGESDVRSLRTCCPEMLRSTTPQTSPPRFHTASAQSRRSNSALAATSSSRVRPFDQPYIIAPAATDRRRQIWRREAAMRLPGGGDTSLLTFFGAKEHSRSKPGPSASALPRRFLQRRHLQPIKLLFLSRSTNGAHADGERE